MEILEIAFGVVDEIKYSEEMILGKMALGKKRKLWEGMMNVLSQSHQIPNSLLYLIFNILDIKKFISNISHLAGLKQSLKSIANEILVQIQYLVCQFYIQMLFYKSA